MVTTTDDTDMIRLARTCWGALEPIHTIGYFAPETTQAYVDLGLHPRLSYFAARSAAFGRAEPAVTVATFYVFAPWLVSKALPGCWDIAAPAQVQQARRGGVLAALRRILGEPDVSEALELAREVCTGLTAAGRPLYAAHSELEWPDDDLLGLWHAATLIREHRGDGHISALHVAGLDPVESLVLGGLYSSNTAFLRNTRGWGEEEWTAAEERLRARDLLTASGELSDEGRALRQRVEDQTDALAAEGWVHLGPEGCRRLLDLVSPLGKQALSGNDLPEWMSSRG